jgi:hypothetical protein
MAALPLIDPEHKPGPLERNKDEDTQDKFLTGPPLSDTLNARTFYNPAFKLVKEGNKRPLRHDDIWRLDHANKARTLYSRVEPEWERERKKPNPSLRRVIFNVFKRDFLGALGLLFAYGTSRDYYKYCFRENSL